jgi:hypothetical protein
MKAMNRVLLPALLAALTFFFAAPVAAFDSGFNGTETSLAEEMCEDIRQSAIDAADGWEGFIATGYTDKQCEKLCKKVRKTCDKAVKNRRECFKKMDGIQNEGEKGVCKEKFEGDAQKICKNDVKEDYNRNKDGIKFAATEESDDCDDLKNACLLGCPGILFDDD